MLRNSPEFIFMEQRSDFYECKLPEDNLRTVKKIVLFRPSDDGRPNGIGFDAMVL